MDRNQDLYAEKSQVIPQAIQWFVSCSILLGILFTSALVGYPAESQEISYLSLLEKSADLESLFLSPGYSLQMASSYDRDGGNQDGQGYIRKEGDWFVIAEMQGPGAISRIWSMAPKGLIRIYIDQGSSPKIQTDFRSLFLGKVKPFIPPFVSAPKSLSASHWSYVPIPYTRFCKVAVQELGYYQIEYVTFPFETKVKPFTFPYSSKDEKRLTAVAKQFQSINATPYKSGGDIEEYSNSHSIAAGERIFLTTLEGPAVIRGFRLQWQGGNENSGRDLVLRCYWDGEKNPSVIVPLLDFFAGGINTHVLGKESNGWWYCYFPMPFHKTASLEIENSSEQDNYSLEFLLALQRKVKLPSSLRTFHAVWRRDNATPVRDLYWDSEKKVLSSTGDENFLALSASGAGHIAGWTMQSESFPESDVMFLMSSMAHTPVIPGTGKYGFFDLPGEILTTNNPLTGSLKDPHGDNFLFRSFLSSPIEFEDGIHISLEHGSGNLLRKDYSSTVYWYQEKLHDNLTWILPAGARHFRTAGLVQPVIELNEGKESLTLPFEAESLPVEVSDGIYDSQDMLPHGPGWSGNQQLHYRAFRIGGSVLFHLPRINYSGWYRLQCQVTGAPDGAIVSLHINETEIVPKIDLFNPDRIVKTINVSSSVFLHAADSPRVRFTVLGKNPDSEGMTVGVDSLYWQDNRQSPETLELLGPFGLPGDEKLTVPYTKVTEDGDRLLLGFNPHASNAPQPVTIESDKEKNQFRLGDYLTSLDREEALIFLTWNVEVGRAGIYRFELEPSEITPFLYREESGRMIPQIHRLLINNILLLGKDVFRYNPVTENILPLRYRIPLQKGKNQLSWLVQCGRKTWIRPVLYGTVSNKMGK